MKSLLILILVHIFALLAAETLKHECPEPLDIFPCYCEEEDDDPEVICNHLTKPEDIYEGVKGLKGHKIYKLSFFKNWILEPIKSDAFKDLVVDRILFENSTINLSSPQFEGMSYLNSIELSAIYNKTNPLVSLDLGHLEKLREIMFQKNRITHLPNDWLKSVPDSLRSLWIEENTIVTMGDEVFSKVKKLSFLVLDSNRIVLIKRSMFPEPAVDLRSINLSNNRIRYLPDDIFSKMPNLRTIEIAGNRLTTLDESIWRNIVDQLTKLDASENPLECDYHLKWLYTEVKHPVMFSGQCQTPENLKGKSLSKLKASDLS